MKRKNQKENFSVFYFFFYFVFFVFSLSLSVRRVIAMRLASHRPLVRTARVPTTRRRSFRIAASRPPLLPPIPGDSINVGDDDDDPTAVRFVLVRHGQSTWNAEGRIQGSSDISVLTEKGKRQARDAAELVKERERER